MGKLTNELCGLLNFDQHRTHPYHPQMDECLECWHGSLKHMLRRCEDRGAQLNVLLKYFLFTYRCSPHSSTGFSLFQIIFSKPARGPIDVLREGWLEGEVQEVYVLSV